jgi:hypothetical protein
MTSRTFFGGFGQGDGDGVMGAPWSASGLTVSSVQVYHPRQFAYVCWATRP